ncbi:aldo/keto reductase [Stutzerimonas azotifigens]|uniref:aldo/keto reductase n=1 Tax=Stutzerimonas azotifigens TaxID=291995 RepID=UPI000424DF77|nr:aldo/keto reductase [Stutzerimonas azotifigens]
MPSRRQFIQGTAAMAAIATLGPALPALAVSEQGLLQRAIPSTGELLPAVGLGTSRTLDVSLEDDKALKPLLEVVRTLVNGGGKLIDTAPSYGRSEQVAGALSQRLTARDKLFLASKVSSTGREAGQRQIADSFAALQTEVIDLMQVHNLQDTATQLALLRELKEQGKVRYIGVTHYREGAHDELIEVLRKEKADFVQFNYSVAERNAEARLLPFCADQGIATLVNRPFTRGNLLSKVKGQPLPAWAVELGASSWAQLLLKFVLAEPAVTAVIPATSNPRYMAENLRAGQGRLPDARQREMIVAAFG